jgi:hypothetical protein
MNARTIISEAMERGISLSLSGGNVTLKSAAKPPDDLLARIKAHKDNIVAILKQEAAVSAPPEPDDAGIEERAAIAAGGVPGPYLDTWARLQCQRPFGASDQEWWQVIDDAGRFLAQWGSRAVEFGWTPGDLFDVPNETGKCGLAWFLHGDSVRSLEPEHAVTTSGRVFDRRD